MSTLSFLKFNNYYNRTLKNWNNHSVSAFLNAFPHSDPYTNLNFDIKDGVETYHVINDPNLNEFPYDYLIVYDDGSNTIKSKWYVKESIWNRKRQWIVTLRRDLLADFWDNFYLKPFYCRKGLPSQSSILCYNSEGMQFNQILKSRTALKQTNTQNSRYIIGFTDKKWGGGKVLQQTCDVRFSKMEDLPIYDDIFNGVSDKVVNGIVSLTVVSAPNPGSSDIAIGDRFSVYVPTKPLSYGQGSQYVSSIDNGGSSLGKNNTSQSDLGTDVYNYTTNSSNYIKSIQPIIESRFHTFYNKEADDFWTNYGDGQKIILIGDQAYKISRTLISNSRQTVIEEGYLSDSQANTCAANFASLTNGVWYSKNFAGASSLAVEGIGVVYDQYDVVMTPISLNTINITVPQADLIETLPYNIFVIRDDINGKGRRFATWFASQYGGANVLYDLQLFPYAPHTTQTGRVEIDTDLYLEWADTDSGFGNCSHAAISTYSTMEDKKIGANQHMCRIISPNGSSAWEFNPSAIGGVSANSIKYEFTLLPFNSYLHIFPYFDGIYGTFRKTSSSDKEGETRGLVCTGPWSLPYSTDNWATYQLQNSAYMDSFNRQIENMTTMQDIERSRERYQVMLGTLQGAMSGAIAGGVAAGPYAAMAGFVAGGAISAISGNEDRKFNESVREENINYTKDQFYNSLQNIKAQARPLAHNSSITIGNSYWPIIEYYEADIPNSNEMKNYFINDLKIHGWTMGIETTVNQILTNMSQYNNTTYTHLELSPTRYIQGDLINVTTGTYSDDAHIANEIAKELNKGVYFYDV